MWPYWFLFVLAAWRISVRLPIVLNPAANWSGWWRVMFCFLVLMVGLRHEVGADWGNYLPRVDAAAYMSFEEVFLRGDPGYGLLNWFAARTGLGIYLVNTVCAIFFSWGLVEFCRAQPRPWLALVVAVPYLVTVVAMGYTRQGVAIGLAMLGLVSLANRCLLRFVLLVALAATFHKTAVILMPLAVLASTRNTFWTVIWVALSSAIAYVLLLQESIDNLIVNYIDAEYQSQGAAIRLAMNALPAMLFLLFRRRFKMPDDERNFWSWMSLGALGFVLLLILSPSSTAVDRVALYWIPLQLFVFSRLPNALGAAEGRNKLWVQLVVVYFAGVLFVWLTFANHAQYWLPYKFYPWVLLFD